MSSCDPKWETHLLPVMSRVTSSIFVRGHLLDVLISKGLLNMDQRSRIDLAGIETDMAAEMFKVLCKKEDGSFAKFCSALRETNQSHLADLLEHGGQPLQVVTNETNLT
eukprot:m.41905 g.41905  ORF g.41905 m.41905 type:complete len:109 (+) comp33298_c0_seq3:140-466(+)